MSGSRPQSGAASFSRRPSYFIPFNRNERFTGREEFLSTLESHLITDQEHQSIGLLGVGGSGKTQVACELSYRVQEKWREYSVFWISALSFESFQQSYFNIAETLGINDIGRDTILIRVRDHLSSQSAGKWLIVLDNADHETFAYRELGSAPMVDLLPVTGPGRVMLVAGRVRALLSAFGCKKIIGLPDITSLEAADLFWRSLISHGNKHTFPDATAVHNLITKVRHVPLAVVSAAAYIKSTGITIQTYLKRLEGRHTSLSPRKIALGGVSSETGELSLGLTLTHALQELQSSKRDAYELLLMLSFVEPNSIPISMFPQMEDAALLRAAVSDLKSYALITTDRAETMINVHRLVHIAIRELSQDSRQHSRSRVALIEHLLDILPSHDDHSRRQIWHEYLPHVISVLNFDSNHRPKAYFSLCLAVGNRLRIDGRITDAIHWITLCVDWHSENAPRADKSSLIAQYFLAVAYYGYGRPEKSVEILEHVVAIEAEVDVRGDDLDRLASQHALASAYTAVGNIGTARELLEHVVATRRQVMEEDSERLLASQHELAKVYDAAGMYSQAVELLEHVVSVEQRIHVEDHPNRLASEHALARVYNLVGRDSEALDLQEHVVAIRSRIQVAEHPQRLASQHTLASYYEAAGQTEAARLLFERVVETETRALPMDNSLRLSSEHALGAIYRDLGRHEDARRLLEHVVAMQSFLLDEDHTDRLIAMESLAELLFAMGQSTSAAALQARVVACEGRISPPDIHRAEQSRAKLSTFSKSSNSRPKQ